MSDRPFTQVCPNCAGICPLHAQVCKYCKFDLDAADSFLPSSPITRSSAARLGLAVVAIAMVVVLLVLAVTRP